MTVQSVTLLVSPEQAEKLVLGSTEGVLQLIIRNRADTIENEPTQGAWLKDLVGANTPRTLRRHVPRSKPASSKPTAETVTKDRKQPRKIEVIRATEKEEISFENKD